MSNVPPRMMEVSSYRYCCPTVAPKEERKIPPEFTKLPKHHAAKSQKTRWPDFCYYYSYYSYMNSSNESHYSEGGGEGDGYFIYASVFVHVSFVTVRRSFFSWEEKSQSSSSSGHRHSVYKLICYICSIERRKASAIWASSSSTVRWWWWWLPASWR